VVIGVGTIFFPVVRSGEQRRMKKNTLNLRLLGELQVFRDGARVPLPRSKKTRALLAYLVVTGRQQRRDRLCSMLWDVADDPRGALRWSLSKLRKLVDDEGGKRIVADREVVSFDVAGADVDLAALRGAIKAGLEGVALADLEALAERVDGELLAGLDLADFDEYQAWCIAEREQTRRQHAALLRELTQRLETDPERAIPYARRLAQVDPLGEDARANLMRLLVVTGRRQEAEQQYHAAKRLFEELGAESSGALKVAYDGMKHVALPTPAPASPEPPVELASHSDLVGRTAELERLRVAVAEVAERARLRVVLLTGEPGVGKSRLLAELERDVRSRGGAVFAGASFEAERDRAYGPWIDALRGTPRHQLGEAIGGELSPLLPELAREAPSELTRDRLFGAVVELIAVRAHSAPPVLLVLDDMHWCDEASLSLLHYVARMNRHRPVLIALAARDGELPDNDAATRAVRSLRKENVLDELAVGPLSANETAELVRAISPDSDIERVHTESAGNPLFALELARAGVQSARLATTLMQLVRERVEHLPDDAGDVLRWGAVLGHQFGLGRLSKLTVIEPLQLTGALELLERHALLAPSDVPQDPMGAYRFAHDLVRQGVYAELSTPRRRLMHHRVATILSALAETDHSLAAETARHASLAGDAALATTACVTAGRRCLRLFAPAEAFTLAKRGMRYAEQLPEPVRTERMLELMEVSYAARRPADLDEAAALIEALTERALDHGRLEHARRGYHVLGYLRWEGGDWSEAERGMLQAERVSRSGDAKERVLAMAEAARCLVVLDRDHAQAEAFSLEAIALSERFGVESVSVPNAAGLIRLHRGELDEAANLADRARAMARRKRDRMGEFQALELRVKVEIERQSYAAACGPSKELVVLAAKLREGSEGPFARALDALCRCAGEEAEAAGQMDQALEELRVVDAKHRLAYALTRAAELDLRRGDAPQAAARAREALAMAEVLKHVSEALLARVIWARAATVLGADDELAEQCRVLQDAKLNGVALPVRRAIDALLERSPTSRVL
jgi:DNA-binding SARP family transcriptional activator